jgi:hypothetical protein
LHQTNCDSVNIMMIVSLTRGGLRDESHMADEAFALSPISARASLPSEEDYEAISHAFMETSRGRWFLGEYAKRNRNADTRMVLDAVARIEQTVATQKQAASDSRLAEALAAIRRAVYEARHPRQLGHAAAVDVRDIDLVVSRIVAEGDGPSSGGYRTKDRVRRAVYHRDVVAARVRTVNLVVLRVVAERRGLTAGRDCADD